MPTWLSDVVLFFASAGVTPHAPTAQWVLQADPALCVLERQTAGSSSSLTIETMPGSDEYRIAITTDNVQKPISFSPAVLTFAPKQASLEGFVNVAKVQAGAQHVWWMGGLPAVLLEDLAGAEMVKIVTRNGASVSMTVSDTAKAVEAVRRCNADQLIGWGADAGQFVLGGMTPVALKDRRQWLSRDQLMEVIGQSRRSEIDAGFRVAVSQDGVIDGCLPLDAKVESRTASIACAAVMKKPLFAAARDASGRTVRGVATFRFHLVGRIER